MIDGIEIMANASIKQISRLDSTTHNLANVNTPGFKAERFRSLKPSTVMGTDEGKPDQGPATIVDYSQGILQKTGNALDMAITGKGFFSVQTGEGVAYTKDGRFTLNENSELVTRAGENVLGRSGKITIEGNDIQISQDGVINVGGNEVGELKLVSFDEPSALVKLKMGHYGNPDNLAGVQKGEGLQIQSGYLELSNVQAIREMVEMINIQRTFESYQKVIQTISEQNKLSTNRIGSL
ncbi:MAG: flagellar hook-basal body protein [Desulfobacula sp.]|nr:flagellar hook-basal body protein [Desulfobacula sp.]